MYWLGFEQIFGLLEFDCVSRKQESLTFPIFENTMQKWGILSQVRTVRQMEKFTFYTPVEDGTHYVIARGGRAASPIFCPEHISKTMLAMVMKFHWWIDLIKAECSAQEP